MSEEALKDMIRRILGDPNFIVHVNNANIAKKRGGVSVSNRQLPVKVQETINRTAFTPEFIRKHFGQAVRTVQARRAAANPKDSFASAK